MHLGRTVTRTDSDGKSHSEKVTDYFRNHETYVKQETVLHAGPGLPPGIHYFPFSFMLPPNLPSSFESDIGHVRYFVKADIVRDWKWNHKVKQHFMVNGILDLNAYPSAKHEGIQDFTMSKLKREHNDPNLRPQPRSQAAVLPVLPAGRPFLASF